MSVELLFYLKKQRKLKKKLHKKEAVDNSLKEEEQKGSLTNKEKKVLKNIDKYRKNVKEDLGKLQKYQYNITYGLDYLFNELDEVDYYEPKEVKSDFDGSYRDKDNNLSIDEYFDIIRPYLSP